MRKFSKSMIAAFALVVVASLGAPANAGPPKISGPDYRPGNGWCC